MRLKKFTLCCGEDPIALGIEDAEGNRNYTMFKEHVESCEKCKWFLEVLGDELKDNLKAMFMKAR